MGDVRAYEVVNAIGRVEDVTRDLRLVQMIGLERERNRRFVAVLGAKLREVDAPAVETRRGPGLQSAPLKPERLERLRKIL